MSKGIEKLREEYNKIKKSDYLSQIEGTVNLKNRDLLFLEVSFKGPKYTPYEDGLFILQIRFNENYPYGKPLVQMRTPIFHPNINNENGHICIEYLAK